jgi:carbonic anhydrase
VSGFRIFKSTIYQEKKDIIEHLLEQGHSPSTMIISCTDLRVAPAELFSTNPGELYVLNNIGGLVPRYETEGVHGILSAIEYAVNEIKVANIIVLGHAHCNGIKMMMSDRFDSDNVYALSNSMRTWLSVASEAREAVKKQMSDKSEEEQHAACERESVVVSLRNLLSYPYVIKAIDAKKLTIHGWHFDINTGDIVAFNPDNGYFENIL